VDAELVVVVLVLTKPCTAPAGTVRIWPALMSTFSPSTVNVTLPRSTTNVSALEAPRSLAARQ
jgi:hypothetical protein